MRERKAKHDNICQTKLVIQFTVLDAAASTLKLVGCKEFL